MIKCCPAFEFPLSPQVISACAKICLAGKSDECCYVECQLNLTGIFNAEEQAYNSKALIQTLTHGKNLSKRDNSIVILTINEKSCISDSFVISGLEEWLCEFPEDLLLRIRCKLKIIYQKCLDDMKKNEPTNPKIEKCSEYYNIYLETCNHTESDTIHSFKEADRKIRKFQN